VLLCVVAGALGGCGGTKESPTSTAGPTPKPTPTETTPSAEELASQLGQLQPPAGLTTTAPAPLTEQPLAGVEPATEPTTEGTVNGQPVRTSIKLTRYTASAKFDTQVLLNPSTDVIYPGSVLDGSSIADGSYREIVGGAKNDITLSYGGLNGVVAKNGGPGIVSGKIKPTLAAFREFHNQVMGQKLNGASSSYTLQATDASTADSFDVHFAAGVSFASPSISAGIKGNFDYSKASTTNKYMIRFAQTFYTVDVDQGGGRILYRSFDTASFRGVRPVYVSSLAYGRLAFITLESSASKEVIAAGIRAILETPALAVEVSTDTGVNAVKQASNLNITVIGADKVVTTLPGFKDLLENGGFSPTNTGQIVAYKLRFVDDNSVANVVYNGEYTLRSVTQTTGSWNVTAQADGILFADTDGSRQADMVDLMGRLAMTHGSDEYTMWERPRSDVGLYPDDATEYTDISRETKPWHFLASTLDEALRFTTVDLYDFNWNNKSVLYGPAEATLTIGRSRTDGGHLEVRADRPGDPNKYVKFRVRVEAVPVY
jgi:hypothetical protein